MVYCGFPVDGNLIIIMHRLDSPGLTEHPVIEPLPEDLDLDGRTGHTHREIAPPSQFPISLTLSGFELGKVMSTTEMHMLRLTKPYNQVRM
jgi:hypothetical protein